ncbi:Hypothetical predicted protein [Olea europaea subsp. europaea]|uniref:Uncharacterized protein n=1 Tax=Olea europaea subsp. europaea TaxID=158383 RepID=A0A8S0TJY3_OLEEU|nr:Hypothetical predicted protein [Olea europaea subsp. europaea]
MRLCADAALFEYIMKGAEVLILCSYQIFVATAVNELASVARCHWDLPRQLYDLAPLSARGANSKRPKLALIFSDAAFYFFHEDGGYDFYLLSLFLGCDGEDSVLLFYGVCVLSLPTSWAGRLMSVEVAKSGLEMALIFVVTVTISLVSLAASLGLLLEPLLWWWTIGPIGSGSWITGAFCEDVSSPTCSLVQLDMIPSFFGFIAAPSWWIVFL